MTSAQAIVVIDDDPSVRRSIARLLRASGFSVRSFTSAEEFLASPPAGAGCLVLDIHLGGISGLDLVDCLDRQGRCIPIVFISAQDGALRAPGRTQSGTIAFLHKPFDESVFLAAVRRALATGRGSMHLMNRDAASAAAALVCSGRRRYIRRGMSPPPTVFVVDDDASVQRALVRLLTSAGYQASGFLSARAFLDAYTPIAPGCLILDLQMPDITGLDLMETLRVTDDVLEVIFLSGCGDVPATAKAMKMGAIDFLTKPVDEQVLLEVVRLAAERSAARWTAHEEYARVIARHQRLTPREREVCALVARGRLNKQIAFDLGTSEKTIKVHRARVMAKLGVLSVAELVRFVDRLNAGAPRDSQDRVMTLLPPEV